MKYGEIVNLGRHRLMCGDATKYEDIEALLDGERVNMVLTDPPYGMKCQHKDGKIGSGKPKFHEDIERSGLKGAGQYIASHSYQHILNDDSQDTARKHYELIRYFSNRIILWGGQYFAHFLPVSGGGLFWDKLTGDNDFSDGELAYCSFGKRIRKYTHLWNGVCRSGNYRYNPKPRIHPTQKPVELHMKILEDFTQPDDLILDCFGGSGTTLIACHLTGRRCFMMEISPDYCDIIKDRYEKLTEGMIPFDEAKAES